jgi:hypothetical protein
MMAFSFRKFTNLLNKGKRLPEIVKPEAPLDEVSFLRQLPVWGLCVKELGLLACEWRYSSATGSTGFGSKNFGHVAFASRVNRAAATPLKGLTSRPLLRPVGSIGPISGPAPIRRGRCPPQSPAPGFGEKYWSLSGFPSHSL